jgi:mRNA interferase RelE/StbE
VTYELEFNSNALQEWHKLDSTISSQFKKVLTKRLLNPHNPHSKLRGDLKNAYKIKLRSFGYRLVYIVEEQKLIVLVLAVGKRNKSLVYSEATKRL